MRSIPHNRDRDPKELLICATVCHVEGCTNHVGRTGVRGMCKPHYNQWYKHGEATPGTPEKRAEPKQTAKAARARRYAATHRAKKKQAMQNVLAELDARRKALES